MCTRASERRTDIARDIAVEAREDNVGVAKLVGLARADDKVLDCLWHAHALLPAHDVLVGLAGRAGRGVEGRDAEVGVCREEADEALANGAGSAGDGDLDLTLGLRHD